MTFRLLHSIQNIRPGPVPAKLHNHRLAYHHLSCAAGGFLKARHNQVAEMIAKVLTEEAGFVCELRRPQCGLHTATRVNGGWGSHWSNY